MHKPEKVIGFDLDGTIIDMTGLKVDLLRSRGFDAEPGQTASGVINRHFPEDVVRELQPYFYHMPEYADRPTLMSGSVAVLERLERESRPFVLISRRKVPAVGIMTLKHHKLWPRFFNEKNAHFVVTQEDKDVKAVELGVTHYVDDEPDTLEKMPSVAHRILYDPHDVLAHETAYHRVSSWPEIGKIIFKKDGKNI